MDNPLKTDLDHILAHTKELWDELRGQRLFITGGTGFLGCLLLESFAWASDQLDLDTTAVVLMRNPDSFLKKAPHLATHPAIQLYTGDVRSFEFPPGHFSHVIHMTTDENHRLTVQAPERYVPSTRRARMELGLQQYIDLPEAIRRTIRWYSASATATSHIPLKGG